MSILNLCLDMSWPTIRWCTLICWRETHFSIFRTIKKVDMLQKHIVDFSKCIHCEKAFKMIIFFFLARRSVSKKKACSTASWFWNLATCTLSLWSKRLNPISNNSHYRISALVPRPHSPTHGIVETLGATSWTNSMSFHWEWPMDIYRAQSRY